MFFNYLKSAWRNLYKRKQFSLLNILGLSIGIAVCLLILQFVNYEESYDAFHADLDRLYRLNLGMSEAGETEVTFRAANHPAAGLALKRDYPQIEEVARMVDVVIFMGSSVLSYEPEGGTPKTFYEEHMYVADPAFLEMFAFPLVKGDPATALAGRENIVITESLAKKYFGKEDPMGKVLSLNGRGNMTVTGVLEDLPPNTHLEVSALFSSSNFSPGLNNAWIWPEFHTYVKLAPDAKAKDVEESTGWVCRQVSWGHHGRIRNCRKDDPTTRQRHSPPGEFNEGNQRKRQSESGFLPGIDCPHDPGHRLDQLH